MASSALVVGANGFVGSHIARELVRSGCTVTGMGMPMPVDLLSDLRGTVLMVQGSAEIASEVEAALDAGKADVVVWSAGHNANASGLMATGESEPSKALAVNATGLFNVLNAAQKRGIRRAVITGSLVVFGPASGYPEQLVAESAPPRPTTGYGLSKAMGEQVAQYFRDRFDMDVTTFRLAVVFGPGRWYGGVVSILARLLQEAAPGKTTQCEVPYEPFDLVHVKDVASAVRLAVQSSRRLAPLYHLNSLTTTYPKLARAIEQQVPGYRIDCTPSPAPLVYPLMNFDLIRKDLGYQPQFNVSSAIADLIAHGR